MLYALNLPNDICQLFSITLGKNQVKYIVGKMLIYLVMESFLRWAHVGIIKQAGLKR